MIPTFKEFINEGWGALVKRDVTNAVRTEDDPIAVIKELMEKKGITNYTINPDFTVDVDSIVLYQDDCPGGKIPIKFNIVKRFFNCSNCGLTSLEGAPRRVLTGFLCSYNNLTSLEGAPDEVGMEFDCNDNKLTTLKGAPKILSPLGTFKCSRNQLTSLEGAPEEVDDFICAQNKLTNLKGAPRNVRHTFSCFKNPLDSFEGGPEYVGGDFYAPHNQLTSLKGIPKKIGGGFNCSDSKVKFTKDDVKSVCDVRDIIV